MKRKLDKNLFAKYYSGTANEEEIQQVFDSEESETMLQKQWDNLDEAKTKFGGMDKERMKRELFKKIESKPEKTIFLKQATTFFMRNAAAFLIPIAAAALILYFIGKPDTGQTAKMVEKVNEKGVRSELILPDGSKVWLNSDSKISYPEKFATENRIVQLEGEAYFEVVKNTEQPFIVKTSKLDIEVLGTRFNVKSYKEDKSIETTLLLGKVSVKRVNPATGKIVKTVLTPNQQAVFNIEKEKFSFIQVDAEKFSSWTQGKLVIDEESFGELVKKLERWYNVEIALQADLEFKYNYTLTVTNEKLDDVLSLVKKTTPSITIVQKDNKITITEAK